MSSQLKRRLTRFVWIICVISLSTSVSAQPGSVEMIFDSTTTISVTAGEPVCFRLVAMDTARRVLTDWDSVGIGITLTVWGCSAEYDSSEQSWSRHADGYTWAKLIVAGQTIVHTYTSSSSVDFTVPNTLFTNGVADVCFQSSKAEYGLRIAAYPMLTQLEQISPSIEYSAEALDNFLVDVHLQSEGKEEYVYAHRPFMLLVGMRDRFGNDVKSRTPLRIETAFPAEIDTASWGWYEYPGYVPPNAFDPNLTIEWVNAFYLIPTAERLPSQGNGHRFRAYSPIDPGIDGISDPFFAYPHAPNPFALLTPADHSTLLLVADTAMETFTWERAVPMDPFSGIQIGRFDPFTYSDSIHFTIHFTDTTGTKDIAFEVFGARGTTLTSLRQSDLASVIDSLSGTPHVPFYEVIWYVEATDGNYSTMSMRLGPRIPGHRLMIKNSIARGVGMRFAQQMPTTIPVGTEVNFELQALDHGAPVFDWNSAGDDVTLHVRNSSVDSDTSARSWNADPDAYSWSKLTVSGQDIPPSAPHQYSISKSLFANGLATASYRSSKAESGIRIEVTPGIPGIDQSSPALTWTADSLDHFLVEVTWHDPAIPGVYVKRPVELIITPRDRYLNTIDEEVPVSLYAVMGSLETHPELGDTLAFHDGRMLRGQTAIYLQGKHPVDVREGRGEQIHVMKTEQPIVLSSSAEFSILAHAPVPFELSTPADLATMNLLASHREQTFTWERPEPPDAVTNILVSRLLPLTISDDIRYTFHFRDEYFPQRATSFPSDNDGRDPVLTITEGRLAAIIDSFAQDPLAQYRDVLWFVEATDGLYTTRSTDQHPTLRGNRLRLFKESTGTQVHPILPSQVTLAQNYPNPFNPTTTIHFATTKRGYVSLKVFNLLGGEVVTIHQGMLDAGEHTAGFDASNLRSGVYVYRLDAEGTSISRRMVVMK